MPVDLRHAEPAYSLSFEIELNQHSRFVSNYPAFVTGFHGNELRSLVLDNTAIRETDVDLALGHETNMSVRT